MKTIDQIVQEYGHGYVEEKALRKDLEELLTPSNTDTELSQLFYPGINKMGEPRQYRVIDNLEPEAVEALSQFIARRDTEKREALLKAVGEDDVVTSELVGKYDSVSPYVQQAMAKSNGKNEVRQTVRQAIESIYGGKQ